MFHVPIGARCSRSNVGFSPCIPAFFSSRRASRCSLETQIELRALAQSRPYRPRSVRTSSPALSCYKMYTRMLRWLSPLGVEL
jgi:hypothetical protein